MNKYTGHIYGAPMRAFKPVLEDIHWAVIIAAEHKALKINAQTNSLGHMTINKVMMGDIDVTNEVKYLMFNVNELLKVRTDINKYELLRTKTS